MLLKKLVKFPVSHKVYLTWILFFLILLLSFTFILSSSFSQVLNFLQLQVLERSQAKVYLEGNSLKFDFDISKKDQEDFEAFSKNLGVDSAWSKGITLELNQESIDLIDQNLPALVYLTFSPNQVTFSSGDISFLNSSLPTKNYEIATSSGRASLKVNSEQDYSLEVKDPSPLLKMATSSSRLYISSEIEDLLELSSKIDTINLQVKNQSLSGFIRLK